VVGPEETPVVGARVAAFRQRAPRIRASTAQPPTALAHTGRDGSFRFGPIEPGVYTIVASAAGFSSASREGVEVSAASAFEPIRLRLWTGGHHVTGRVLDIGGGTIPGARVIAVTYRPLPDETHERVELVTEADASGAYELRLPRGHHELRAEADGYAGGERRFGAREDARVDLFLSPAARLAGRVITADGAPVPGAEVRLQRQGPFRPQSWPLVTTDEEGQFSFEAVPAGTFVLVGRKGELLGDSGRLTLEETGRIEGLELTVRPALVVEGRVVDASGRPVPQARIDLRPTGAGPAPRLGTALADEHGRFRQTGLLPGVYDLVVSAPGLTDAMETFTLEASTRKDVVLRPAFAFKGRVETVAGAAASGAHLRVARGSYLRWARTDAEGRFAVRGLPAGPARVTVQHAKEAAAVEFDVPEAEPADELIVRLAPGATLSGVIVTQDGAPVPGASIMMTTAGLSTGVTADVQGRFWIDGLPPGRLSLRALPPPQRRDGQPRSPGPPIEVTLTAGGHLSDVRLVLSGP
jgi:protocatechuate 3,4-dioxygenase beta subunit